MWLRPGQVELAVLAPTTVVIIVAKYQYSQRPDSSLALRPLLIVSHFDGPNAATGKINPAERDDAEIRRSMRC